MCPTESDTWKTELVVTIIFLLAVLSSSWLFGWPAWPTGTV